MFRSYNDEAIQPWEYFDTEEQANNAFWSALRMRWEKMDYHSGRWVDWSPTITREEWKAQRASR
ncbi:MAG: hypothetical protein U0931_33175 [Vulcanimicrobiota bacterium]